MGTIDEIEEDDDETSSLLSVSGKRMNVHTCLVLLSLLKAADTQAAVNSSVTLHSQEPSPSRSVHSIQVSDPEDGYIHVRVMTREGVDTLKWKTSEDLKSIVERLNNSNRMKSFSISAASSSWMRKGEELRPAQNTWLGPLAQQQISPVVTKDNGQVATVNIQNIWSNPAGMNARK